MTRTVAIAGLGAIGAEVARALDRGIAGLELAAVSARDTEKAKAVVADFANPPAIVGLDALTRADIVVEAMPAVAFNSVATPAVEAGRILMPCSVGALLTRMDLIRRAGETGARIVVPTGAVMGLDAVRALAEAGIASASIETRKPPNGLMGAPYLVEHGIDLADLSAPLCVFEGNALEATKVFPSNVNVAAALALAGIGPEQTMVTIWADPGITRNIHTIRVEANAARLTMSVENVPSPSNPRTSWLSPLSVVACLRGLAAPFKMGS